MSQADGFRRALLGQLELAAWRCFERGDAGAARWEEGEVWALVSHRPPRGLVVYLGLTASRDDHFNFQRAYLNEERDALFRNSTAPGGWHQPYLWQARRPGPPEAQSLVDLLNRFREARQGRPDQPLPPAFRSPADLEEELRTVTDPLVLLQAWRRHLSDRKLRLFACAACRRLPVLMEDVRNVRAVEAAERYADGMVPKREMKKARKAANVPWLDSYEPAEEARAAILATVRYTLPDGHAHLSALLCDLAGDPFRPLTIKPSWLRNNGGAALHLASAIYEEGAFADLPILADALEEAGCTNAALLYHCRRSSEHARGCWAIDTLLGKS